MTTPEKILDDALELREVDRLHEVIANPASADFGGRIGAVRGHRDDWSWRAAMFMARSRFASS